MKEAQTMDIHTSRELPVPWKFRKGRRRALLLENYPRAYGFNSVNALIYSINIPCTGNSVSDNPFCSVIWQ